MKLNLNKLQYDEDTCIYIEKHTKHYGGIRTERKYLQSWDDWERHNIGRVSKDSRQDVIKRKRRLERRYTKELRNLSIIEGWKHQEEQNNWWEEKNIDLPLQSFNEWLESHIA